MTGDYTHPRINDGGPISAAIDLHHWADLALCAATALANRQKSYPALIDTGKMDAAEAEADIAAWSAIAADWHWIATGDGQPADRATLPARIAALDTSITRFFARLDRIGGATRAAQSDLQQITHLAALRWHAERERTGHYRTARANAALGHSYRAANGHPTIGQMQKAQSEKEAA